MNKFFYLLFFSFFIIGCSTAQFPYSTSNKKAIKLFEEAQKAPDANFDPQKGPDYKKGIEIANQALEKDPQFWEAHLLIAELFERTNDYVNAIVHYKKALEIDPNHSVSGSTLYYLSASQLAIGQYDDAMTNIERFLRNPNANENLIGQARQMQSNARFAKNAIQNPKPFNPINVGPGINTALPEYFPTLTVDSKTLLFTRRINDPRVEHYFAQEDFFVSNFGDDKKWGTSFPMPQNVNTINNEGAPTIASDGKSLIFVGCSDETGTYYGENREGKGSCDLFFTQRIGNKWTNPINLPGNVNTMHWETQPSLSADGKTLYFIRGIRNRSGSRDSDIYVSYLQTDGTWGTAQRLPNNVNTTYAEESVCIHPDGRTLYFASRGHVGMGGSDLFVTRMDENGNWSKPENLGYPINTIYDENSLLVAPNGEIAFFASNRAGGYGDLDIYYFELPQELRPVKTLYFEGKVFDAVTKNSIPGHFQLTDLKTGKVMIISDADKVDGTFMVALPINREYAISVTYTGYFPYTLNFNLLIPDGKDSYHLDIPLNPETSQKENVLANVFFDLGKSTLRPESKVELNEFVSYLKKNPKIRIELGGHTDSRGNKDENLKLSNDRAKTVYDYLIANGISDTRLTYKGFGSITPIISDAEIAKLSSDIEKEQAHQKNRRTVYTILP
ncbi:MAG: tetratricopeptide repeat protein [Flavobacteriales bacterium]|nr:tetratricopeptide repeat protein [Crocinitomicaceae bacterium]NBX79596.1 tetratricopeptide repeat protein [Flavobacteriales bacterium]NCA19929.1 tetratricopeptide repeat protein [Crocinitomicaceae bacterium]